MSQVLPISLLGAMAEKELTTKMSAWLSELYSGWFSDAGKYYFVIANKNKALQIDNDLWRFYGNSNKLWLAFKNDVSTKNKIMSEMFELDSPTNLKITKFIDAIYEDFADSNVNMIFERTNITNLNNKDINNPEVYFGSGAVLASINNGLISFPIVLSGELVRAICSESNQKLQISKPEYDLVAREISLDEHKYKSRIEVHAGKVKVTIKDFTEIEIGDVVMLDTKIGTPFPVVLSANRSLNVQLGVVDNKKAIQFIE